jgi:hypothetical protein
MGKKAKAASKSSLPMKVLGGGAAALICTAALAYFAMSSSEAKALKPPSRTTAEAAPLHTLSAQKIGGIDFDLAALAGKAAVLVNVASS